MISIIIFLLLILTKVSYSIINSNNVFNNNNNNNNITNQLSDINYLSQLPLDKLIKVQKSINDIISCFPMDNNFQNDKILMINQNISDDVLSKRSQYFNSEIVDTTQFSNNNNNVPLPPAALPLIGKLKNFSDLTGDIRKHYGEQWDGGLQPNKPTKIQTIFQISITALAFLAFGGYLLCMIVQAIQSKGTTYYHPAMLPMVNPASSGETMNKNGQTVQVTTTRKKRRPPYRGKRDTISDKQATPDPIQMYNTLIQFAEGYVKLSS